MRVNGFNRFLFLRSHPAAAMPLQRLRPDDHASHRAEAPVLMRGCKKVRFTRSLMHTHHAINLLITTTTAGSSGKMTGMSFVRTVRSPTRLTMTFTGQPHAL